MEGGGVGGENEIGMNGEWEGVEGRGGAELEDEKKIGKGGKMGVRTERGRGEGEEVERRPGGRGRKEDWKR